MAKFNEGDRVVNMFGESATVIDSQELISISWDSGYTGFYPAAAFEPLLVERKFIEGQFVRVVSSHTDIAKYNFEVGIVIEDDGDEEDMAPYTVALFDDDGTEEIFSAFELIPWVPLVGEHVLEAGVEDDEEGVVISVPNAEGKVRVLWDSFPLAQDWLVSDLEPIDTSEPEITVGDTVEYHSQIFKGPIYADVVEAGDNVISVNFHNNYFPAGSYSKELFSKAA